MFYRSYCSRIYVVQVYIQYFAILFDLFGNIDFSSFAQLYKLTIHPTMQPCRLGRLYTYIYIRVVIKNPIRSRLSFQPVAHLHNINLILHSTDL